MENIHFSLMKPNPNTEESNRSYWKHNA